MATAAATEARSVGLRRVRIQGFRSVRDVVFEPGSICALVGEVQAGKSNLLSAIRALLDPDAPPLTVADVAHGGDGRILVEGMAGGSELSLEVSPPARPAARRGAAPSVLFLPASERATAVLADGPRHRGTDRASALFSRALAESLGDVDESSEAASALAAVNAVEACCVSGVRGVVFLVEEPELYLRPQAQRYLYRLLRALALEGNQVIYSTHSPAFLNVGRLEELALVRRDGGITRVVQPAPAESGAEFRLRSEFDAERSELFLARAVLLVEGQTEKLALPFVFQGLGHDADREGISIVQCGGKSGIPLIAGVCKAVGIPFVVVHDRDAAAGADPILAEQALNELILSVAGADRTIVLEPDFERVSGLRGRSHKPERAWRRFTALPGSELPEPLVRAVELALDMAEGGGDGKRT